MAESIRLSEQQFQIFQAVNKLGKGSAKQVQKELGHLGLAHTTIATVLSRLEKKGVFASEVKGRERFFHSIVDESAIRRSMVESLVSTAFRGDPKALIAHLVSEGEINSSELDELREMVKSRN